MTKVLACGCVAGAYWCGEHDIYARTPARVAKLTPKERAYDEWVLSRRFEPILDATNEPE